MKNKNKISTVLTFAIYLLLGFLIGIAIGEELPELNNPLQAIIILFVSVLLFGYLQVFAHEFGHLVFGLLSGYKFSSFRIGIFTFVKNESGNLKLKFMHVSGTAGQCLLEPPEPTDGKIPTTLYNMGGVIMNVFVSAVAVTLKFTLGVKGIAGMGLLILAFIGFALAAANGIPMQNKLICNDGMNTLSARTPDANRALYNTLKIAWYQSKGCRMKDMPSELFKFPDSEGFKNPLIASEAMFSIDRIKDFGYLGNASDMIDTALRDGEALNGIYVNLLKADRLFVSLMAGKAPEYIESLLDKEMQKLLKILPNTGYGVYTAYAYEKLYKGNLKKANEIRASFGKKAKHYPYQGEIESVQILMDKVDFQWDFWNQG